MGEAADAELELFRHEVNCAAVLERIGAGWALDKRESTRHALKYRRGAGEILIVNHEGRGWWDPMSTATGDVSDLVQHLDPSLNFGQVRKTLRSFVGVTPTFPEANRRSKQTEVERSLAARWATTPRLRKGDPAWRYLAETRGIPHALLTVANAQDCVRTGAYGSAWFAHRDDGIVGHVEIRGPDFKGSLRGGHKSLFRFGADNQAVARLALLEAPIDALSLAALESVRADTLYAATGGGMGPGTLQALRDLLGVLSAADGVLVSGADANGAGDRFAIRHQDLATEACVRFERLRPPEGTDWNDVLVQGRGA